MPVKILNRKQRSLKKLIKNSKLFQPRPWRIVVDSKMYTTHDLKKQRQYDFHIYGSNGELLCSSKQRYENKKGCVDIAKEFFAGHPATLEIVKPK